ncbi:hypothetical protein CTAYLR_003232 [Chrysophaeum taylorii]|uniref:GrpE protein homolog n=1 Tax=Chrysophaeum taylorii TaxID=2483200 RepID=A0AAD7UAB9_9STRA|nr:hypothetical protein CTAYLR_003232 [Chrysophaeum taylorii]
MILVLAVAAGYALHGWRPSVRFSGVSLQSTGLARRVEIRAAASEEAPRIEEKAEEAAMEEKPEEEAAAAEEEAPPTAEEAPAPAEATDDITSSPVFLKKKIEVLEKEVAELEESIAEQNALRDTEWEEWGQQIEKMQGEFANIKRRERQQREQAETTDKAQILELIFPATDNFARAKQYVPKTEEETALAERYDEISATLDEAFEKLGVTAINDCGVPFDPMIHSAALYQPSPEYPLDTISAILEAGYKVNDFLVRPATVIVSSGQA